MATTKNQIISTLGTDGVTFATRLTEYTEKSGALLDAARKKASALESNFTSLRSAVDCAVSLREFPKARLRGLEDAFAELEVPNPKFAAIAIRGVLGHSRAQSKAAKFTSDNGVMVRDSAEATMVALREAGIESWESLKAAYKGDTESTLKTVAKAVARLIFRSGNWTAAMDRQFMRAVMVELDALRKAAVKKAAETEKAKAAKDANRGKANKAARIKRLEAQLREAKAS